MNLKQFYTGKAIGFIILLLIIGGFYAFNTYIYNKKQGDSAALPEVKNKIQLCFALNTKNGDKAYIVMNIADEHVTGTFDWEPAEKDSKTGPFEGTISAVDKMMMARTLDVLWKASGEGKTTTEQLKIIMGEGNATPGFGEMKDRGDGVLIYANPDKIVYEPNLTDVDCNTGR